MTDSLIAPLARARFVVTLPPEPSLFGRHLQQMAGTSFTTLTDTEDAFLHRSAGAGANRLVKAASRIYDYSLAGSGPDGQTFTETFHAKVVLADGVAAYVGSANFLYRSREANLECGFLTEGVPLLPFPLLSTPC